SWRCRTSPGRGRTRRRTWSRGGEAWDAERGRVAGRVGGAGGAAGGGRAGVDCGARVVVRRGSAGGSDGGRDPRGRRGCERGYLQRERRDAVRVPGLRLRVRGPRRGLAGALSGRRVG